MNNNYENPVIRKKNAQPITITIVEFLVVGFLLLTVFIQLNKHFYSPLQTEIALYYEDVESVLFKGVYIRDEQQVVSEEFAQFAGNPEAGVIAYTNKCGSKLAINAVIAAVYSSQDELYIRQEIDGLNQRLDILNEVMLFTGDSDCVESVQNNAQIEAFAGQLSDTHLRILRNIGSGDFEQAAGHKNEYLRLQGKINAVRGTSTSAGLYTRIDELQAHIGLLQSGLRGSLRELTISQTGYFVSNADGYEEILRFDNALDITREQIENIISNPTLEVAGNVAGKVIDSYKWRMAAIVESDKTKGISQGNTVNLRIGAFAQTVRAQVISAVNQGDGTTLFVFECELLNEEFVRKRVVSVRLLLDDYSGIRIPLSAIKFDHDNNQGVFVRNGSVLLFKRVNLLRSGEGYVIVENTDRPGWLKLFDEIVVSGSDLYDGKIVLY
jgi:putative membrane fusion protein